MAGFVAAQAAIASDHVDGPITTKHKVGDITDFYVFPSPQNPDNLTLVVNTYPLVPVNGHFSEKVKIHVYIHPAKIDKEKMAVIAGREEMKITCSFDDAHDKDYRIKSTTNTGLNASAKIDDNLWEGDFAVFAGRRADTFFFDREWFFSLQNNGKVPPPGGKNLNKYMNVLSVILEIPKSKIFEGEYDLLAFGVQTTTINKGSSEERRLDYFGRPEITNVILGFQPGKKDIRDMYNGEKPFAFSEIGKKKYDQRIRENIQYLDKSDGKIDWTPEKVRKLSGILVNDYLVIDLSKKVKGNEFFSIEKALLAGKDHDSCGGRLIPDDIMDTLFNTCINNKGSVVSDGVDAPENLPTKVFPYLVPNRHNKKKNGIHKGLRWSWLRGDGPEWIEGGGRLGCRMRRRIQITVFTADLEVA